MENNIKVIEWEIDDVIGELRRISLVSEPAIEEDFLMFSGAKYMSFKTLDNEKRIITGPAMRADIKIPRRDENGEIYYGYFSKDTVRKCAELFFKTGSNMNKTNLEHEFEIDGVYAFESWLVENPEMDKSKSLGFSDVREGDWFVSMKVDNDAVWNNYLKTGIIKGFSVEVRAAEVEILSKIKDVLLSDVDDDTKWESLLNLLKKEKSDILK